MKKPDLSTAAAMRLYDHGMNFIELGDAFSKEEVLAAASWLETEKLEQMNDPLAIKVADAMIRYLREIATS